MELITNDIHETSDSIYYDLFEGGYLNPKIYLKGKDLEDVQNAMDKISEFIGLLEENELIEYM